MVFACWEGPWYRSHERIVVLSVRGAHDLGADTVMVVLGEFVQNLDDNLSRTIGRQSVVSWPSQRRRGMMG